MIALIMTLIGDDPKEQERFEQLFYLYEQRAYRRAFSFVGNEQDALDVLQEAFVSIAKNFSKIYAIDSRETRNYVMTVVENKARKELEKRFRRKKSEEAVLEKWRLDVNSQMFNDSYSELELRDMIQSMPEIYSDTLYMFYVHGYTAKEIADIMCISSVAVRKRLERARSVLKNMIGEENG